MIQKFVSVNHLSDVSERQPTFLAMGSFDGVHRGHQHLLGRMVTAAREAGCRSAVLTFFPHPKCVTQNLTGRYYINSLADRVAFLGAQGVDLVITHPFDDEVRSTRAADFVDQLCASLDMRQIWGGNFAFGYQREGTSAFLQRQGLEKGFSVQLVENMVEFDGRLVSSSRIRHGVATGDIADVNGCLGRAYAISGTIVQGDHRGRTIGFPTANLEIWDELLLPVDGVYGTYAWVGGQRYVAATNVGVRPTVNGRLRMVETHLLNFNGDLYGQTVRLEFARYIRPEKKFAGLEALKAQIHADVHAIEKSL